MSKREIQTETEASAPGGAKKKGRLLIVIGIVVLLVAGGGGAWMLLGAGKKAGHAEVKVAASVPPTFFTLDPFVVNLAGEVQHYLQVGIDLKIADEHVKDQIKAHLPEIRNGVLLLLSSKQIDELSSLEGKNQLRAEIREAVNQPLGIHTPAAKPAVLPTESNASGEAHAAESKSAAVRLAGGPAEGVLEVLLTSFVIQ
jgi:flagellar protein FliL